MTSLTRPAVKHADAPDRTELRARVALVLPAALPMAMASVFLIARRLFGRERGYSIAFAIYWAACLGLSCWLIGGRRCFAIVRTWRTYSGASLILLIWPVVGAFTTRLLPFARKTTVSAAITTAAVAAVNGVSEELLWRGVFVTFWPRDPIRGWIWPALGFGSFHLAPQIIRPSRQGAFLFTLAATVMGLSWGRVVFTSRALSAVLLAHIATDAAGVENARYFWRTAR